MAKAKNEAKIKFTAETGEFNDAIKSADKTLGALREEAKLNATQMQATGKTVEGLQKEHEILGQELKASESKVEALSAKLEASNRIFGEGSESSKTLQKQLTKAKTEQEKLRQAVDKCGKEIEEQARSEKEAASETSKLTKKISAQETELSGLKKEYTETVLKYGKTSDEAKKLAKRIGDLSGDLKENKAKLNDAEKSAENLDKSFDDLGDSSENIGSKMKTAAVGVAAIGAAFVAAGKNAIDAFNEVDEGADNVIKATGATGETAKGLEESYKNVASSIVGDFGSIGSALGEVNTRFGYTGSDAETATKKFLKFSEVTGMDATEAVKAVSRAIESAGLETSDYGSILDALTSVGQATGVSVDTLATSLTDYGAALRGMGYDTNDSIAMLAQFEKAGVDSASVIRGMRTAQAKWTKEGKNSQKEFEKLVKGIENGSVDASEAYEAFGSKAGGELVDAIQTGRFSYEDMVDVVKSSKGALDRTFDETIDGGYELDLALQNTKMALAEAGEEVGTTLTPVFQTFSSVVLPAMVDGFKNTVQFVKDACSWLKEHKGVVIAVASVIGVLTAAITAYNIVQGIKTAMDAEEVTTIWGLVAAHWAQATAAMAAIAPYILIVAAIAAVIAIIVVVIKYWDNIVAAVKICVAKIVEAWRNFVGWIDTNIIQPVGRLFQSIWQGVKVVWDNIVNAVKVAIMFIGSIISAAFDIITLPFRFIWENCKDIVFSAFNWINNNVIKPCLNWFKDLWAGIKKTFSAVGSWFSEKFNAAKNGVVNAWKSVSAWFSNIWAGIKRVFAPIGAWFSQKFNAAKNGVKNAWAGVKNFFSGIWSGVKNTFSNVGSWFSEKFTAAKNAIANAFANVKEKLTAPFEKAKNAIKGVIDKIKGFFSGLKLKFPNIKMPHFKITGKFSLNPPSVPKLGIEWYDKGGIMTKPTVFGMNGNNLMVGGETKPEAIVRIDKLQGYVSNAVEKAIGAFNIQALATAVQNLAGRPIKLYINGREVALATAGDSDSINGQRSILKDRGLAI